MKKFGRWTIIKERKTKGGRPGFLCVCDCGNSRVVNRDHLINKRSISCGCFRNEQSSIRMKKQAVTHGMRHTPTYNTWVSMIQRCTNPKTIGYIRYGEIKICKRWFKFENFFADMGVRPKGKSLDRINNSGNYKQSNCRWVDRRTQANNRRSNKFITADGAKHTYAEWEQIKGLRPGMIASRLYRGWDILRVLNPINDR